MDSSIEYERNAQSYLRVRDQSSIGFKVVRRWASALPVESEVLEIACGGGYPVTRELCAAGLRLWAVDSSKTLLSRFNERFPEVRTKCERVQDSSLFDRRFDAAIAIGIVFLLPEPEQHLVLGRIADSLKPKAHFLFTAPLEVGTWRDLNTGIPCTSLGIADYTRILHRCGLALRSTIVDAGGNNHYDTIKVA